MTGAPSPATYRAAAPPKPAIASQPPTASSGRPTNTIQNFVGTSSSAEKKSARPTTTKYAARASTTTDVTRKTKRIED